MVPYRVAPSRHTTPGNAASHLALLQRGGFEMHSRLMQRTRDDLHRITAKAVAADRCQIASAIHQQAMPMQKPHLINRHLEFTVKLHH